jgi:hypothetical protein
MRNAFAIHKSLSALPLPQGDLARSKSPPTIHAGAGDHGQLCSTDVVDPGPPLIYDVPML